MVFVCLSVGVLGCLFICVFGLFAGLLGCLFWVLFIICLFGLEWVFSGGVLLAMSKTCQHGVVCYS